MGRAVRAWLNYHAMAFGGPFVPRMTHQISSIIWNTAKPKLPAGWVARRLMDRDAYIVGPWWYVLVVAARDKVEDWLFNRGALGIHIYCDDDCVEYERTWWPNMPRYWDPEPE